MFSFDLRLPTYERLEADFDRFTAQRFEHRARSCKQRRATVAAGKSKPSRHAEAKGLWCK